MKRVGILIIGLLLGITSVWAQATRMDTIKTELERLARTTAPGLNQPVEFSVSNASIQELIRGLAASHNLNITIDPQLNFPVTQHFSNEQVKNVLLYLADEYELDVFITGSIISLKKRVKKPKKPVPKEIKVQYRNDRLYMDLKRDTLSQVVKKIVQETEKNITLTPGLENQLVNIFLSNMEFEDALQQLAIANNLSFTETDANAYVLYKSNTQQQGQAPITFRRNKGITKLNTGIGDNQDILIDLTADDVPIADIIRAISQETGINHFLVDVPEGNVSIDLEQMTFEQVLSHILRATPYTFRNQNGFFIIGNRESNGLGQVDIIKLQHRSTDTLASIIPAKLTSQVELITFPELNSLIVCGPAATLAEIRKFVEMLDQPVPVVLIEVIIVDYIRSYDIQTGIRAGIGDEPVETRGEIFPGVDVTVGSGTINNLIDVLNGNSNFNLGQVTPNFYASLQLLENNGRIKLNSVPKLSTLNGHVAEMSLGQTEYYVDEQISFVGSENPITNTTRTYQPVHADLTLRIRPMVAGDSTVTLNIDIDIADFTGSLSPDAPPGTTNRSFKSIIRVKNQDMIVLGGLEEREINDSGRGLPWISRVPVIKWFFSSRNKSKRKAELNVFIKPTIIY